jgi:hypothetical protein
MREERNRGATAKNLDKRRPLESMSRALPYLIRNAAAHLHLMPHMFSIKNVIFIANNGALLKISL